ncbi:MAG: hypothetical protein MN733_34035 [Nitrososphaera sp.]|nr:hypothetical protein [Nitrososphaera sp.]
MEKSARKRGDDEAHGPEHRKGRLHRVVSLPATPPGEPSKSMRKVGRLREKAAAASAAGRTKRVEKFTSRADKRASKENIKQAKRRK